MKIFFLILCLTPAVFAIPVDGQLRVNAFQTGQKTTVEPTAIVPWKPLPWLDTNFGAKVGFGWVLLENLDYFGEGRIPFLHFFDVALRISHTNRIADGFSETSILAKWDYDWMPFSFFGLFGSFGVVLRLNSIGFITWIPSWRTSGALDWDFAAIFGFRIQPSEKFKAEVSVQSMDEFEILNIHNPFAQGQFFYKWRPEFEPYLFLRYRILLGFGRLDVLTVGLGLKIANF